MSEDQGSAGDDHTISLDHEGISVVKRLALEEFDTPAVVFTIESSRDGAVYVQITDPLPESIDPDDVGLHPEYDSEGWRRRGGDLQFEGRIDPGETVETVYGLRVAEVEDPSALLADPTVDELVDGDVVGDPSEGIGDDAGSGSRAPTEAVDDGMPEAASPDDGSEDADTTAAGDDGSATGTPEEAAAAVAVTDGDEDEGEDDGEDDPDAEGTGDSDPDPSVEADPERDGVPVPDSLASGEGLAAALAAELEAGEVSEETKATLSDHLELRLSNSSQVRLDSVQARLSDLEAYTDALEGIIDRLGTDEDAISDLEAVREDLEAVETQLEDTADSIDDLTERTDEVATTTTELESTTADLERTTEEVRDDLQTVRDRLDDLEALPETVDAIEGDVVTLRDEVAAVRDDVEDDVAELRAEVEDLKEWRETLAATIGGGMGGEE